ncbi:group II intron reverse transcriptase domain-containing protein [Candidatus Falkowbacteria bacterium]|nr:group II intron reverse transcriptase domain-containing protein [Candidatus Falkowbacteria bacterium]
MKGKRAKSDVQAFGLDLFSNILDLHKSLVHKNYCHGNYKSFYINDPKRRHIHKANVRDRLLHHAVYRILYPFFDKIFIADSFSCRLNKGTHRAINRFRKFVFIESKNHTRTCWVLKIDIKRFFASIDHKILLKILSGYIEDADIIWLLRQIIESFSSEENTGIGLPLGNLTSQLFANVYLNQFDQWVKHKLKIKFYIRYADDMIFMSHDKQKLLNLAPIIGTFLRKNLKLDLHPEKIFIKTIASGVDFLDWLQFPKYRILRKKTKERMFRQIKISPDNQTLQSYRGLLSHGNTYKISNKLLNEVWLRQA